MRPDPGPARNLEPCRSLQPIEPVSLLQAHTCFHQIDLPKYTDKVQVQQMLAWAADSAGNEYGFG